MLRKRQSNKNVEERLNNRKKGFFKKNLERNRKNKIRGNKHKREHKRPLKST
jgi:hypothetical protein